MRPFLSWNSVLQLLFALLLVFKTRCLFKFSRCNILAHVHLYLMFTLLTYLPALGFDLGAPT